MKLYEKVYNEMQVYRDTNNEFIRYFNKSNKEFIDKLLLGLGWVSFDVIKFDEYMQTKFGYDIRKDGSLMNFIEKKFGKDAVELIKRYLK